jgi:hypothetical protein
MLESLQGALDGVLAKPVCSYPFLRQFVIQLHEITCDAIFEMKFKSIFGPTANERLC